MNSSKACLNQTKIRIHAENCHLQKKNTPFTNKTQEYVEKQDQNVQVYESKECKYSSFEFSTEQRQQRRGLVFRRNSINEWKDEDCDTIFQQYLILGPKWKEISNCIPQKSCNSIKNKFYGQIRKILRKLNKIGKEIIFKFSKPIKYEALIRVLQAKPGNGKLPMEILETAQILREQTINFCRNSELLERKSLVAQFIHAVQKFSLVTRCYKLKKCSNKENIEKGSPNYQQNAGNQEEDILNENSLQSCQKQSKASFNHVFPDSLIFQQRRTKEKIDNIMVSLQDIEMMETASLPRQQDFQAEVCRLVGIQFIPAHCLLQEFF